MAGQRPTRYRGPHGRPAPPASHSAAARQRPASPGLPPRSDYDLIDASGRTPRGGGKGKMIALGVFILIVAFAAAAGSVLKPQPSKTLPKTTTVPDSPSAPKQAPGEWEQRYDATFRYASQTVAIRRVQIDKLSSDKPRIRMRLTITPSGRRAGWIRDKSRFQLTVPGSKDAARSIEDRAVGTKHNLIVTFRWPRKHLHRGSRLLIRIPGVTGRSIDVGSAVELPKTLTGIEERHGAGGL